MRFDFFFSPGFKVHRLHSRSHLTKQGRKTAFSFVKYPLHADAIYKAVHRNYEPKVRTVCLAEGRGRLTEFMMRRGRSQRWIAWETYRYESPCEQRTPGTSCPVLKMTILRPLPPVPAAQALRPGYLKKFTPLTRLSHCTTVAFGVFFYYYHIFAFINPR